MSFYLYTKHQYQVLVYYYSKCIVISIMKISIFLSKILIIQLVLNKVVLPPTFSLNLISIYFDKDILLHVSYSARMILFHFLTYLNNVNWYKQTVVHSSLQKWILVINIFPILNIYPWFRNILSWRVVGCCEERVFTFNLQSVTFSIVKQCEM